MTLKQEPFHRYHLEKKSDTFTIKLNEQERKELEEWKHLLQQEKDSTCFKQMAKIGAEVLREQKIKLINETVLGNYRKNKRLGIVTFD
ncbi:MAG: hypothetical protein Q7J06_00280 [Bacteroidales bacterium]|nr:hypothetical protein [Bacteroidales bacterium]